jgi:membrane protein
MRAPPSPGRGDDAPESERDPPSTVATAPEPPGAAKARRSTLPRRAIAGAQTHGTAAAERGRVWVEAQGPDSRKGATISWVRRYQAADGQLYALLLGAYFLLTVLPVTLVAVSYAYDDPTALAHRMERRLGLQGETADLFSSVVAGTSGHRLSGVLIAMLDIFIFGLGFARVLQLAHARAWGIDVRKRAIADQARYAAVLVAMLAGICFFVLQSRELEGRPAWIAWLLDVVWIALLLVFFVWAPRMLLDGAVSVRQVLPGAVFTVVGLIALRLLSSFFLRRWLVWYSTTYGAFGIVIALFFWIILAGTVLVLASALSPALAERRDALAAAAR